MYRQLKLMEALKNEYQRQKELVEKLEQRQQELPHGSLSCKKGCYYRVISEKGRTVQIPDPASLERRRQFKAGTCRISIYKESAAIIEKQCVLL